MAARPAGSAAMGSGSRQASTNMNLIYHQTIIPTQKITHCVVGTFTLPGASDFVVVRHDTLELWTLHVNQNTAECVHSTRLFTNINQVATVPTVSEAVGQSSANRGGGILDSHPSSRRDQASGGSSALQRLAITSETGTMVLLRYDLDELPIPTRLMHDPTDSSKNDIPGTASTEHSQVTSLRGRFVRVSEVDLGRSGARLTVPGARLAVDPLGRAVFVAALMRQKIVVPLRKHEEYYTERINNRMMGGGLLNDEGDPNVLLMGDVTAVGNIGANDENTVDNSAGELSQRKKATVRDIISFGSPVEAHRQTMIYSICALDGATENATFAALEQELPEVNAGGGTGAAASPPPVVGGVAGQAYLRVNRSALQGGGANSSAKVKQLVVYAFASGLQQVQRTHLVPVPATAHRLVAVPATPFGPGGVLVCTDAEIIWYDVLPQVHGSGLRDGKGGDLTSSSSAQQHGGLGPLALFKTAAPFPRRADFREQLYDPMIVSHASTCVRNDFFMLLQDDQGDMFRVSLTLLDVQRSYDALRAAQQKQQQLRRNRGVLDAAEAAVPAITVPSPLVVTYFDTIPPTTAMALFRRGFVFAGSESAPTHGLYKIIKDGYGSDAEYILSRMRMVEQSRVDETRQRDKPLEDAKEGNGDTGGNNNGGDPSGETANGDGSTNGADKSNTGDRTASDSSVVNGGMGRRNDATGAMPPPALPAKGLAVPPAPSVLLRKQQPNSRVVPLFHPHQTLRHMVLLKSYPNTPPVASLIVGIPQGQQKQPQVQIDAVVGRGSDSVLFHARYGYAARLESSFTLQAVFTHLMPLASATGMQAQWLELQHETARSAAFLGVDNSSASGKRHSSKKRSYHSTHTSVCDDKLLLSTRQGTTVLSLGLGKQVEPDTLSGFITSEHTIAAGTLRYGVGYVQITPTCILVLPHHGDSVGSHYQQPAMATPMAEGVTWMHPHGKRILAADISGNTMVVSFTQAGGIASFDMGISGSRLQQLEMLPTFPHAPAVSLLRDPDGEANMFSARTLTSLSQPLTLAAIATVSQEVYIVSPKKLREPLETIRCTSVDDRDNCGTSATAGDAAPAITSVLLTYLGRKGGARRLFCFIGHIDGTVTRCELDHITYKVINRAVLTCGTAPCQMIAGDGERVCYILCGEFNWRCDVRDGMPKTVPWRFPTPQAMYAAFRRPAPPVATAGSGSGSNIESGVVTAAREELVLGVAGNTLSLFAAGVASTAAETGLEYSFSYTSLPVAGRRLLQHPTRPECLLVIGTEHRGYGVAALRRAASAARYKDGSSSGSGAAADGRPELSAGAGGIPLDKPQRSLNHPNYYVSTLQLYNRRTDRLDPPIYFQEGEAVLSAAVGSFVKDFGREPVVVLGCAEHFTHGSGLGVGASWTQGRLRAFRFVVSGASGPSGSSGPSLRLEQLHDTPIAVIAASSTGFEEDGNDDNTATQYGDQPTAPQSKGVGGAITDYPSALHICADVGLLFVGMGAASGLHVYAWGQRRFLRKRRLPNVPSRITSIETVFATPPNVVSSSSGTTAATTPGSTTYAADLYRCGPNSTNIVRERRLLIVCGTVDQSVFIATVQPGTSSGSVGSMSFLMLIARDAVPRSITCVACLDERTIAAGDRFGNVVFLRLPQDARLGFAEPVQNMTDIELVEAERYAASEQLLEEIAFHRAGQLVTSLRVHDYDPSDGTDPTLALRILFYATTLGAVGAYTPFVREEDAALAAHLQPLIASHVRCPLQGGSGQPVYNAAARLSTSPAAFTSVVHHVIEGDYAQLLLHSSTSLFSTEARSEMEAALAQKERAEAAQRNVLSLPKRVWPTLGELVAKQRALVALPP
ncbi:hypothetical protein, conserved [Trypanosoma brucei brucei TREU927]|uniref:Uncharacterized protein n=1 Tax=Trypanosoma brucei brucei (strain 927/4 GUTat10.1) TaxID=185431 RepID=Q57XR8_TRYB2|nr:hypothetical protein, conserved [Trypanosoma brucei brucei TREU927]AAX69600.1 hypothetical protein, conserved [Trypanosoma brucei]AAZ12759.1 hypothetical protein, conserved [Trypanosoma brucei brucei TREU927]